jgi:hypothetical protein
MRRLAIVVLYASTAACGGNRYPVGYEPDWGDEPEPPGSASAGAGSELSRAFEKRLTVWTKRDGTPVLAPHCRNAPVDCRARLETFASLLSSVADEHDLDPWMLAAIAVRESMLDPSAVGARGEAGIVQLHPRGVGRGMPYVVDADYRDACQERVDACQGPVVARGAEALADAIARCGGVRAGLGRYASGRCDADYRYVDRVFDERDRLRALAD